MLLQEMQKELGMALEADYRHEVSKRPSVRAVLIATRKVNELYGTNILPSETLDTLKELQVITSNPTMAVIDDMVKKRTERLEALEEDLGLEQGALAGLGEASDYAVQVLEATATNAKKAELLEGRMWKIRSIAE